MARKSVKTVDESSLTKMQIRKLNMLKKSVGDEIGTKAFVNWMSSRPVDKKVSVDKNAVRIVEALQPLIASKKLTIPRGGYQLRRGRGRVIVEAAAAK
jgi:hypothetical protein